MNAILNYYEIVWFFLILDLSLFQVSLIPTVIVPHQKKTGKRKSKKVKTSPGYWGNNNKTFMEERRNKKTNTFTTAGVS